MSFFIILILGFVLMWVLIVLPQRRRQAAQASLLSGLEVGDEVVTAGGLYGEIETIEDDEIGLRIAPGVVVRVARRAIAAVVPPDELEEGDDEAPAALDEDPNSVTRS